MSASSPHAFRYEPELCSLAEGQTLGPARSGADAEPRKRRAGLRARLAMRRARRRSAS